jgi:hypothetical protein
MPTVIYNSKEFRTPTANIADTQNFSAVDLISVDPLHRGRPLFIEGEVGSGAALTSLRLTWAALSGGTHTDLAVDGDFDTATALISYISASPYKTPASGTFKLLLAAAPAELVFYAKSSGTTLTICGSIG